MLGHGGNDIHAELLREVIEIDVAGLVNALGHIDPTMPAPVPAAEYTVANPQPAAADNALFRIETCLQE